MQRPRDLTIFVVSVLIYSLVLSAGLAVLPNLPGYSKTSPFIAIAIASVMLGARGVSWRRRLAYAGVVLGVFISFNLAFTAVGAWRYLKDAPISSPLVWVLGIGYVVMGLAFPLAALLLFVGRDPSVLWVKRTPTAGAKRGMSATKKRSKKARHG